MDEQKNNTRVIITNKADLALDDLEKKFGLTESYEESIKRTKEDKYSKMVAVSLLAKDFALGPMPEKNLVSSLQKELEVSQQKASEIAKEIINKVVPLLQKISEEELSRSAATEEAAIKILMTQTKTENINEPPNMLPNIKLPENIAKPLEETLKSEPTLPLRKIKKSVSLEETNKPPYQQSQTKGPDNYREPIE